jgi:hypothetical protein
MTSPAAPAAQQRQDNEPHGHRLRTRDLLRDFEQDSHEVYNSPQANLGAALAELGQLEDTPATRRLQAHIHIFTAQVEERGLGYSRLASSSYSRTFELIMTTTTGSPIPLTPITPFKQQTFSRCTTKSSSDVPNMTKVVVLPTTSTSARRPTPHRLVLERSTTSRHSHDVSG